MVINPLIATRLWDERQRLNLKQTETASLGGVSLDQQEQYEAGNLPLNDDYLHRLHQNGFDVLYILTGIRPANHTTEVKRSPAPTYADNQRLQHLIRQTSLLLSLVVAQLIEAAEQTRLNLKTLDNELNKEQR
ncbi:MAG: hypothetical protein M0P11_06965 [Anaerolineaceae bacterium]|nr:hypothetical protein [Anaerolineaceae bacterium]